MTGSKTGNRKKRTARLTSRRSQVRALHRPPRPSHFTTPCVQGGQKLTCRRSYRNDNEEVVRAVGFEPTTLCFQIPPPAQMIFKFCVSFQPFTRIGTICFRFSWMPLGRPIRLFCNTFRQQSEVKRVWRALRADPGQQGQPQSSKSPNLPREAGYDWNGSTIRRGALLTKSNTLPDVII